MGKFVRIDNCAFTKNPSLVKSAVYAADDIENGTLVAVGGLKAGEREVHEATAVTGSDALVGIVCTPEVIYDQRGVGDADLANFVNKKNEVIRVGVLVAGDIFSIGNSTDTADMTVSATLEAKHIATEKSGRYTYQVYEVVNA